MATRSLWPVAVLNLLISGVMAAPVGSGFTYQGDLKVSGIPANAAYDFEFALFNVASSGGAIASVLRDDTPISNGLFTVELDFTDVPFVAAQEYFLEVRVRDGASTGGYTQLLPRQKVTPAPYALNARTVQAGAVGSAAIAPGAIGSIHIASNAVGNSQIATDAVGSSQIAVNAVGSSEIGTDAVGAGEIADGTVGAAEIATDAVGSAEIAAGAVSATEILDDTIGAVEILTDAIGSAELANLSVGNAELANLAVTDAKIANATISAAKLAFVPGDVTGVTAGSGLTGGGTGGDLNLAVNTSAIQARITGSCPIGEYFRGIAADGTVACEPVPGVPRITTVDDPVNGVGGYTSVAIGNDGLAVISYHDYSASALKVAKCANAACTGVATITTVDDPVNSVGYHTSIAIGSDGLPVISYWDSVAGTLKVAKCATAACTGAATITTVDDPPSRVGEYTSIAIGSDGLPVISYQDSSAHTLKVAKCANAACTGVATITTVDIQTNWVGYYTSIAIGGDGHPVISYQDATANSLKVAKCTTVDCTGAATITTVDDPANLVGSFTSIAIGSDGLPVISYHDGTAGALKVAKCTTVACTGAATITTVDAPANNVGYFTSIAIGSDGLPTISYQDYTAISLKVAKCTTVACTNGTITTVDDPANNVGYNTSIAIGSDGLPVISYYDNTAATLKVAKCGTRSCQ